jgi:protein-histidine pros-kinase
MGPQADQKQLTLVVRAPDAPVLIRTDRRALSQIVINLTANAIKYTDRGSVTLELKRASGDAGGRIEIQVIDTGPGISPEDRERLFDPFARLGTAEQRSMGGSGLGLHLSQKLAERLGGQIRVESKPGQGSRFSIVLPE